MLLFSKVVLFLLKLAPMPMTFLFIGAVIGSLPLLFKQAGVKGFTPSCVLFPLAGISLVALTAFIPADLFAFGQQNRPFFPLLFAAGVFISAALVLPGISASYMLLILGLYQPALNAVEQGNLTFLLSLGAGVLAGVILCTKLLGAALVRFPRAAYLTIIGFVIASVKDVFPGVPCGVDLPLSALTFLSAAAAVYFVAQRAEN